MSAETLRIRRVHVRKAHERVQRNLRIEGTRGLPSNLNYTLGLVGFGRTAVDSLCVLERGVLSRLLPSL